MIRHRLGALLLAAGAMSALGGVASTDAMASEREPMARHDPSAKDPNPVVTPCGACYLTKERRLYVSLETIGSARVVDLELESLRGGQQSYRWQLAPYRVESGHVVYLVPQGPAEDVGGGVLRWTSSQGRHLSKSVSIDTSATVESNDL
ncbi:hypothetical protein WMF04_15395 [Sorangium sp. So ce260]|uniref:hypothetical protein n=1 Tax=Sorangium sp. So ce260 TaxID=3133291 RepID=UPI003F5F2B3D